MTNEDRLQPSLDNPRYWQYGGDPVMLLGGSETDHIFLHEGLEEHLDQMHRIGGNYVRNTMSQREGARLKPHRLLPDDNFDLDQWNEEYWTRFKNMLKWTAEREIFVQIEVWDRFDYSDNASFSDGNWQSSPWRPANNINYTCEQTGFADHYPEGPWKDEQPFFHSVPGMEKYREQYDLIRQHQERFVHKMLSYSLTYGHVLYCMNNEPSTPAAWGQYWIQFIKAAAADQGVLVCTTDMFDDAFEGEAAVHTPLIFDDAEHYMFADISQVNSRLYDETHWERLLGLLQQVNRHPRPSNHTKIYGSGYYGFGTGGPEDGVERFWRNILGGSASARFHRPDAGNGLNDLAQGSIKAARLLEDLIKFWDVTPHMELLTDRDSNEAYLAAEPGERYALYFPNGGSVRLDLSGATGIFGVTWISISMGRVVENRGYRALEKTIEGGESLTLAAPYKGGWVAAIVKQ